MKKNPEKFRRKLKTRAIIALIIITLIAFSPGLVLIFTSGIWALCTIYPSGYVYFVVISIAVLIRLLCKMVKQMENHIKTNKKEELSNE